MPEDSVQCLPLKFTKLSSAPHEIFFKEYTGRSDPLKPERRTIFISNLPPYTTEQGLLNAFSDAGLIENIILQKSDEPDNGYQTAFMIFKKRSGLVKALNLKELKPMSTKQIPILTGLVKWIHEYNSTIIDPVDLERKLKKARMRSDKEEAKKRKRRDQGEDDDGDGWTTVTTNSRRPGLARKESVADKIMERNKEKTKKKELKNFYKFQIKQEKQKKLIELRKQYEEAKEKVEQLKKLKIFKPF